MSAITDDDLKALREQCASLAAFDIAAGDGMPEQCPEEHQAPLSAREALALLDDWQRLGAFVDAHRKRCDRILSLDESDDVATDDLINFMTDVCDALERARADAAKPGGAG